MDTPTQALLGAVVGQAGFSRRLGRQAVVWGAVGGLIPDLDVVLSATGPLGEMLYHRGPTHALWFGPVVGSGVGYALWRWRGGRRPGMLSTWLGLMIASLTTHPLLDAFTTYGTQLFTPFSTTRVALDAVPIIDPLYSALLVLALAVGAWRGTCTKAAHRVAVVGLGLSSLYLLYGLWLNEEAEARARRDLASRGVNRAQVNAYPTLLQVYLRRIVARQGNTIHVGWVSLWRRDAVSWESFEPAIDDEVARLRSTRLGRVFEWFAAGQTAARVERRPEGGTVVEIDDLRYGLPATPRDGLWGIRAVFAADGQLMRPAERFRRRPALPLRELVWTLLVRTFGAAAAGPQSDSRPAQPATSPTFVTHVAEGTRSAAVRSFRGRARPLCSPSPTAGSARHAPMERRSASRAVVPRLPRAWGPARHATARSPVPCGS